MKNEVIFARFERAADDAGDIVFNIAGTVDSFNFAGTFTLHREDWTSDVFLIDHDDFSEDQVTSVTAMACAHENVRTIEQQPLVFTIIQFCHQVEARWWDIKGAVSAKDLERAAEERIRHCLKKSFRAGDLLFDDGASFARGWWEIKWPEPATAGSTAPNLSPGVKTHLAAVLALSTFNHRHAAREMKNLTENMQAAEAKNDEAANALGLKAEYEAILAQLSA